MSTSNDAESSVAVKPHRRFRFSLRAILLAILAISVVLAWVGHELMQARRQAVAVAALRKLQCRVDQRSGDEWITDWLLNWFGGPDYLPVLRIDASGTKITDADLALLETMPQLGWLHLNSTEVTDAGLTHLRRLTQLELVDLRETKVTAAGQKELGRALPTCNILWIDPTPIEQAIEERSTPDGK